MQVSNECTEWTVLWISSNYKIEADNKLESNFLIQERAKDHAFKITHKYKSE